jgi:hypothetical protein
MTVASVASRHRKVVIALAVAFAALLVASVAQQLVESPNKSVPPSLSETPSSNT